MAHAEDKQTFEFGSEDRAIIAAALADIAQQVRSNGEAPMAKRIADLRAALSVGLAVTATPPSRIKVSETAMVRMLSALETASAWRLTHEVDRSPTARSDTYKLVAELEFEHGARDLSFDLASGMHQTTWFLKLEQDDAAFFSAIEQRMADVAGRDSQIAHHVFEIPVPWDFKPDLEPEERAEAYIVDNGGPNVAIHRIYIAEHSNDQLWKRDFAGVHCEISGFQDEIAELREFLAAHLEEITAGPAVSQP